MATEENTNTIALHQEDSLSSEESTDPAWKSYNLLSLDGGGIRGYWSLLVLEKLMEFIAIEEEQIADKEEEEEGEEEIKEEQDGKKVHHSFWPQPLPDNVSQVPPNWDVQRRLAEANNAEARRRAVPAAQRYLPCHYFDYICGSSTGALIAIMLGRFRMTVPDCKLEYENLAVKVFGKPRHFTTLNLGLVDRTKYDAASLKKVFEEVTERRSEQTSKGQRRITFPSKRGLCKTFVTSDKRESVQPALQTLYLIRSYDHYERTSLDRVNRVGSGLSRLPRRPTGASARFSNRTNTGMSNISGPRNSARKPPVRKINYGDAQDFEIWEVARAATAAPFYFDPLKIDIRGSSEHMILTDAGFGHNNNPTKEGTNEIEWMYGTKSIGIIVSVGTARRDEGNLKSRFRSKVKEIAQKATDTEQVHSDMHTNSSKDDFLYYRLNDPDGLKMELDEWEPKPSRFNGKSGSKTLQTIGIAFTKWAVNNNDYLQRCAEDLVRCRRARSVNRAKWERYATGAEFTCRVLGCSSENFDNCEQFQEHLTRIHGVRKKDPLKKEVSECRRDWRYQPAPAPAPA
ncbi:hypothetical protein MMC29_002338 [Sticta canariensis]|nr:hypothetical protein [Sticta canariensis]